METSKNESTEYLVGWFNYNSQVSGLVVNNMYVGLKTRSEYQNFFQELCTPDPGQLRFAAGVNLSSLFAPYTTNASGYLPILEAAAEASASEKPGQLDLLPFYFDYTTTAASGRTYIDTYHASGVYARDTYGEITTGEVNTIDHDRIRHNYDIRGIGLRMPMMAVGWGYDTDGKPFPPGSGTNKFVGEVDHGYQVDQREYVAAPIDIRYDKTKKMWVASGGMKLHQHLVNIASDGGPAFATFFADNLVQASGLGYFNLVPALIVNT